MSYESDILRAKRNKEVAEALVRLEQHSSDFRLLINEVYLKEYALDLLYRKTSSDNSELVERQLDAVSYFKLFLTDVLFKGEAATTDIEEAQTYINLSEDL